MKILTVYFNKTIYTFLLFCFAITLLIVNSSVVYAVRNENMATDAYALGLANSMTADPNFLLAIHANPAGLSMLGEGGYFSQGFTFVRAFRTGTFTEDPDFPGFMGGRWSPSNSSSYDGTEETNPWPELRDEQTTIDPLSNHGGPDPVANTKGTNSRGIMYVPIPAIGRINVPISLSTNQGAARRQPGSRVTLAWGMYAPFGGGLVHGDKKDAHNYGMVYGWHQHYIYSAPSIAYEFSPELSVGLSVGLAQRSAGAKIYLRAPKEMVALTRVIGDATKDLDIPVISAETYPAPFFGGGMGPYEHSMTLEFLMRDDFCPTFNLGLLWRPTKFFSFGACYRSESKAEMTGPYKFTYGEQYQRMVDWSGLTEYTIRGAAMLDNPYESVPYQKGTITGNFTLPRIIEVGIKIQPIAKLKFLLNLKYSNWGITKTSRITFDQRIQPLRQAKVTGWTHGAYDVVSDQRLIDTWNLALGIEYQLTEKLALRMGVEDRPTSVDFSYFSLGSTIPGAMLYGVGAGIKLPKGKTIDIAIATVKCDTHISRNNSSTNLNSTDFTKGGTYVGLDYKQDMEIHMFSIAIRIPLDARKVQLKGVFNKLKRVINIFNPFTYIK